MTVIYIGSSNTAFPLPGYALYGGSKVAPQFLVEVLEREIGHRGVSVNSIVPTAIEGMDVYGDGVSAEFRNFIKFLSSYAADGKAERCRKCKRISCGGSDGVCELAASACCRWCTGLGVRTKLLADLTTKEFETILIKRMLFLTP
jgi:NAD(P)-dependent dehydrogenase (short-subunit alcohol dehydrogenase family)